MIGYIIGEATIGENERGREEETSVGDDVAKLEPSCTLGGNVK
jgi:hypothetical protein